MSDTKDFIRNPTKELTLEEKMTKTKPMQEDMSKRFCTKCGRELKIEMQGAENFWGHKYGELSGKRKMVKVYVCSRYWIAGMPGGHNRYTLARYDELYT